MSKSVQMWTDGGSRSNPGPAAVGIVIKEGGAVVFEAGEFLGHSVSNNQAEYQALYRGLSQAKKMQASSIQCYLDSQLVVEQVNGRFKVKDAGLREWWSKVQELLKSFEAWQVAYVPRAQNAHADKLVNQVLDEVLYN
jgi:ribonuclease HI